MYSIYVTNKLERYVFVRLSVEKIDHPKKLKEELDVLSKRVIPRSYEHISFLVVCGFYLIPAGNTRAFLVQNVEAPMYVSVVHSYTIWEANFPIDPKMYGCVAILSKVFSRENNITVASPYNPEAVWLPVDQAGGQLPSDVIKAGQGRYNEHLYFGRKPSVDGGMPCAVSSFDGARESREVLKNTGFELIRAKRGDPIPPNAVMTGVTEDDGSLFVGRVGVSIPCYITTDDGKIQSFVYELDTEKRVANGEVMVLTR